MNIYQYAMKLEKDSENYYNKLMGKTDDVGLQTILKMLVDEEVKHFSIVEQMMKTDTCPELAETDILKNAKNIFAKIKGKKLEFNFDLAQADFYRKAQEFEEKSHQHYLEISDKVGDKTQKEPASKVGGRRKKAYVFT